MAFKKVVNKVFIVLLVAVLIGCSAETTQTADQTADDGEAAAQGGEIKFAYTAQPPVLDPHVTKAIATSDIMRPVFETLLTIDSDYNIQPMLADSYEQSEDGKTITFHLREGVLFHNGKEMLAEDVAASMNRWKDAPGTMAQDHFSDATFEAKDDYTVEMHLSEPVSTALAVIAFGTAAYPAIMPKEIVESADGEVSVDEFVGTGPFKFVEWKQDQHVHLTKFEDYQPRTEPADGLAGKREALVDDLYFLFVPDSSTRLAGLQSGEYDIVQALPYDDADMIEEDPTKENVIHPGGYLTASFNKKEGLFTDVKAREAVVAALEMESILTAAYSSDEYYILSHNMMMSHQTAQWQSDVGKEKYNQNDPEKAKQLLDEAGYGGEEITIITTRDYQDQYEGAVVMQQQLEQIGMKVNLEVYDWPTLLERTNDESAYDIFVMGHVATPEPSSNTYIRSEYAGWTNSPELDELLEEYRGQPTLDDAKALYDDLQEWYWEYLPIIKFGDFNRVTSVQSTVKNLQYLDGFILWNVSNEK